MNDPDYLFLSEKVNAIEDSVIELLEKVRLLERMYGKVMDISMRCDNLEVVCGMPVTPNIYEKMTGIHERLTTIEKSIKHAGVS